MFFVHLYKKNGRVVFHVAQYRTTQTLRRRLYACNSVIAYGHLDVVSTLTHCTSAPYYPIASTLILHPFSIHLHPLPLAVFVFSMELRHYFR